MVEDRRASRRRGESDSRSLPSRRGLLAVAGATISLTAGCLEGGPGGDGESNEADPETVDESGGATGENETDEIDETEETNETNGTENDGADEETEGTTDEETEEADETDGGNALDHPSAENMDHSPVLGPEPIDEGATVIAFDDPSCPACAYFEENVFPDLESHVDDEELSIVWRGIPVIEDWSEAALQAMWTTYERDVDAFWELRDHLFSVQESIGSDVEAVDESITYLTEETSLDAEAIRSEAEAGRYADRIAADESAGARAGLDATPHFYLFRDGEYRTKVRGAEDYRVFQNALEL